MQDEDEVEFGASVPAWQECCCIDGEGCGSKKKLGAEGQGLSA